MSVIAMTFVGGLMIATSVPALAITATGSDPSVSATASAEGSVSLEPQSLEVASEAQLDPLASNGYAVEAAPPPVLSEVASVGSVSIVESGAFSWPVVDPTRISDPFGPRESPCSGCSTNHKGVDFPSGDGTPVMAVADGVVTVATENGGGLGVHAQVQSNVGGELITSTYSHMQYGSLAVVPGQRVSAGQQIGLIGATGQVTGPHLHFEMFGADEVRFDGLAWLTARLG